MESSHKIVKTIIIFVVIDKESMSEEKLIKRIIELEKQISSLRKEFEILQKKLKEIDEKIREIDDRTKGSIRIGFP